MRGLSDTHDSLLEILGSAPIRQMAPEDIEPEISQLLAESKEWLFRGGSARFLRGTTMPKLAAGARTLQVPVMLALLDPRDLELCDTYANYRSKIGRRDPTVSARSIQAEILATVYIAGWYMARTRLQPRVVLLRSFSQLRYDIGSDGLLVTVADRSKPALYASASSWYYRSLRDELEQLVHGNPALELPGRDPDRFPPALADVTVDHVRNALVTTRAQDGSELLSDAAAVDEVEWDLVRVGVVTPYEPNT
jgi:hypothetical protein